jgi:hypothetical protein
MKLEEILSALKGGREANRENRFRQGNIIHLPAQGRVIFTGDLHGHERNFERLVKYADLGRQRDSHLVLHELIHSTNQTVQDQCHSYVLVARAAQLKAQYPDQVHILLGNHAMSQVSREEILKNDLPMVRALNSGLYASYSDKSTLVMRALDEYILSLSLAVRTENRVWQSHSLPSRSHIKSFDDFVFEKILTLEDMGQNRSLHSLLWDRRHTTECVHQLRQLWDVDTFVIGHQPQPEGWSRPLAHLIILSSEHNLGSFLPMSLSQPFTSDEVASMVRPLAELE